ncbi:MAG: Rrf2 family transcriptional regulator [Ruminiclostridium sp.]|nr:Rrf2 family transcriptional regulator [Ruminiclostridium sp.]
MHITLETDYAIRIVDFLAKNKGRFDATTISENTSVPSNFAMKILRKLSSGKIVTSYKGTKGGYELTADLNELSVYDVVETMEGIYRFSRCLDGEYNCTRCENGLPCTYQHAFQRISDMVCEELKKLKFSKM